VIELVNALTPKSGSDASLVTSQIAKTPGRDHITPRFERQQSKQSDDLDIIGGVGLGDFSKVWQFLGTSHTTAPATDTLPAVAESDSRVFPRKDDYASDGATYKKSRDISGKKWSESDGTDGDEPGVLPPSKIQVLTKTQRKKARRKERKLLGLSVLSDVDAAAVSESEADSISTAKRTPARKASAHFVPHVAPTAKNDLRPRDPTGKIVTATPITPTKPSSSVKATHSSIATPASSTIFAKHASTFPKAPNAKSLPAPTLSSATPTKNVKINPPSPAKLSAVAGTPKAKMLRQLAPASVPPSTRKVPHSTQESYRLASTPTKAKRMIEPKIVRSGADRHWALLMKIISNFYEDRENLVSPMNMTTHNNDPKGLHIFVDASNIFIGFMDQLKRSRGIPQHTHVPEANLSFDALALLMERRRPVAKRVLVGSTPNIPAFDKAKAVGYECSILEKVYKSRELTERQKFFKELEAGRIPRGTKAPPSNAVALVNNKTFSSSTTYTVGLSNGYSSGSETTTAPQFAPAKMIEQGVDEILHLKILESIVDSEAPSTIVLATGDAAAAEYSQGFMAMAERALKKGWTVELVSWSKNINTLYTRHQWTQAWGDRFRIITLDDYAEELLDM